MTRRKSSEFNKFPFLHPTILFPNPRSKAVDENGLWRLDFEPVRSYGQQWKVKAKAYKYTGHLYLYGIYVLPSRVVVTIFKPDCVSLTFDLRPFQGAFPKRRGIRDSSLTSRCATMLVIYRLLAIETPRGK